ncbi:MAG TPA: shikimate kinase [Frankiaceae bacterium]|jgi:shikimate kinase
MAPTVILVGAPGAGKTTVGRLLAERLGCPFADTDHLVEEAAGTTVPDIFVVEGEAAFRARETAALTAALRDHGGVLALGGGAVLAERNRALLREAGAPVVLLSVPLSDAVTRVGLARDRPVLALNPRAMLRRLLAERAPLYAEVATHEVDTGTRGPEDVVAAVLALLEDPSVTTPDRGAAP